MGWETFSNVVILIATALIILYTIITIILQAESNIIFWMMRPSEKAAMDIVGMVAALGGTSGKVTTSYKTEKGLNEYYLINSGKITCIITKSIQSTPGVMGGKMTTINCYSGPIDSTIHDRMDEFMEFEFVKYYDNGLIVGE